MDSLHHVPPPPTLSALTRPELEALLVELFGEVATLKQTVAEQREEIARLKGLKGRPNIKPSGMEKGTTPAKPRQPGQQSGRGKVAPRIKVEDAVIRIEVPPGSVFKGHEPFVVQDLVIAAKATRYLRERWVTPDGRTILAPLPQGTAGHFGPELRRFVLVQYHQGQSEPAPGLDPGDAPAAGVFAIGGGFDLEAAVGPLAEREPRGVDRRSAACSARGAGNIALGQRGRHRRAPCRKERVLHADRQ